jgi:spore coat protein U-like protein
MSRRATIPVLLAACLLLTAPAFGIAVCTVGPLTTAFGVYNSLGNNPSDTLTTITVSCTGNIGDPVNYTLALSTGQSGSFSNRVLSAGSAHLGYNLYLDSFHATVWGDGTGGSSTLSGGYNLSSTSQQTTFTVYGQINGGQNSATVSSGYSDSVVVTLTY